MTRSVRTLALGLGAVLAFAGALSSPLYGAPLPAEQCPPPEPPPPPTPGPIGPPPWAPRADTPRPRPVPQPRTPRITPRATDRLTGRTGAPGRTGDGRNGSRTDRWRAKSKANGLGTLRAARVSWQTVFLPVVSHNAGYGVALGTIDDGIRLAPEKGGWDKDARPSLVLVHDPSREEHRKALAKLSSDARVTAAAHYFNAFRLDARGLKRRDSHEVELRAYDAKGNFVARVSGAKALPNVLDLLGRAFAPEGRRVLSEALPPMMTLLEGRVRARRGLELAEANCVCEGCGKKHGHVERDLARYRKALADHETAIGKLVANSLD